MRALLIQHINTLWLALAATCLLLLLIFPDAISRESVSDFLNGLGAMALLVYILLSLTRALLMIPCTPFVLAGGVTFPESPLLVMAISYAGIVAGAFLVYSFPAFGSYDEYLERKYPEKIRLLEEKLHGRYSFWIIAGWSLFPLVPTDLICYVAGLVKLSFRKLVIPVVVGEIPLVTIYVLVGVEIGEWLRI
ncbi:MAG: VTT domain-containing protein [Gammaproteobacteria bacterium]